MALILGVQIKMIMLIQHEEKKENSSSKRYKVSKWSFGDGTLVTDWNTVHCHLHFTSIEIPDDAQINDALYTFSNFFNQGTNLGPIYDLVLEIYASFPMCNVLFSLMLLQIICQIGCWDIDIEWIFSKT